jgi:hypothetical protein
MRGQTPVLRRLATAPEVSLVKEQGAVTKRPPKVHTQLGRAAVQISAAQIFLVNDRMNQMLIQHLAPAVWKAKPPTAKPPGTTRDITPRTIAAIFTHIHNVRCKWVRLTAPHLKIPPQLNRAHWHAAAGPRGIGRERRSLRRDAR